MPEERSDLVVVGGGVMGLATAWWAARSRRVILVERFEHGHVRGASHGGERIFRYGYTDPVYVHHALAADELWKRLESESGRALIDRIGCLDHGDEHEIVAMAEAMSSAGVAVESYAPGEAATRWPGFRFASTVLHQPRAGRARAADVLDTFREEAARLGADLRFGQRVEGIQLDGDGVVVATASGTVRAPVAVVTAGAWTAGLLDGSVALPPLTTTREQVVFFDRRHDGPWPSFIDRSAPMHYGLPAPDGRIKIGEHHTGPVTTGDTRTFDVDADALGRVAAYAAEWLPGLEPSPVSSTTCLYTLTSTEDFVLDRAGPVVVGTAFAGHGFKFAPRIGQLLADMAAGDAPPGAPFAIAGRDDRPPLGPSSHR